MLITLLALTALCAATAGLTWYLLGNEAFLKRQLHATVLRATGRSLRVEGALSLSLGSTTTIEARDVHFSNPGWAAEPDMLTAGRLFASVDLRSLFGSQTVIHDLELNDCRLALIENELGEKNWNLLPQSVEKDALSEDGKPEAPPFRLDHLHISHCQLTADAPQRTQTLSTVITELALDRLENGSYRVQAGGQVADLHMTLSGQFGLIRSFWQGGPFEHEIELRVGEILLHSSGSVADALTGLGANVSMRFSGPEFARVTNYLAVPAFSSGAFDFSLEFRTEGETTVLDVNGDLGTFDLLVSGELDRLLRPTAGEVHMTATGPDLDALGQFFGIHGLAQEPFTFKSDARFKDGRMSLTPALLSTSQDRIELNGELSLLPDLHNASLDFSLQSNELGRWFALWGRPITTGGVFSASGHVTSNAGGLLSGNAEIQHRASHLKVSGSIGQLPVPKQPDLDFEFDSPNLSELAGLTGLDDLPVAPARAKGHFSLDDSAAHFSGVVVGLADNQAKIDGTLFRTIHLAGSEFKVSLDIPSTSSLGLLFGYSKLPDKPMKVNATLKPAGKGLEFQVSNGSLGEIQLSLKGGIADVDMPSSIDADVAIELPSARLLGILWPQMNWPDLPLSFNGGVQHQAGTLRLRALRATLGQTQIGVDGQVSLTSGRDGSRLELSADGLDLSELINLESFDSLEKDFSLSGTWRKSGEVDNLENVRLQLGNMKAVLNGTVDNIYAAGDIDLLLQLDVPVGSDLNAVIGPFLTAGPLSAESRLQGSLERITLSGLSVRHGDSHVTGELQLVPARISLLSGSLHADLIDLRPWLDYHRREIPGKQKTATGGALASEKRVFGDDPVFSVGQHAFQLEMDLRIDRAELVNAVLENIRLGLRMRDDELRLDPLELEDRSGASVKGKFALDGTGPVPQLDMLMHGENVRLGLFADEKQEPSTYPPMSVALELSGKGPTWHEIAGSLDGRLRVFQGKGFIATGAIQPIFSDFIMTVFNTLIPSGDQKRTRILCTVFAADVESGKVKADPIIIHTDQVTVVSGGTIDLRTERIDMTFNSKARKGLGMSAGALIKPFIKIGGSLAAPALELDAAKGALSSGAAVATGGLSVLARSFADRFLSSRDPCGDARKKLEEKERR